jgi:hypothetical protein
MCRSAGSSYRSRVATETLNVEEFTAFVAKRATLVTLAMESRKPHTSFVHTGVKLAG